MPDQITVMLRRLGAFASALIPHRVDYSKGFEPDRNDIRDFQNDLTLLANKVDAVLLAYGEHLHCIGAISEQDMRDHFTGVLLSALDGNAMFCIEAGIEERIQERAA